MIHKIQRGEGRANVPPPCPGYAGIGLGRELESFISAAAAYFYTRNTTSVVRHCLTDFSVLSLPAVPTITTFVCSVWKTDFLVESLRELHCINGSSPSLSLPKPHSLEGGSKKSGQAQNLANSKKSTILI